MEWLGIVLLHYYTNSIGHFLGCYLRTCLDIIPPLDKYTIMENTGRGIE